MLGALKAGVAPYLLGGLALVALVAAGFFWYQERRIGSLTEALEQSNLDKGKLEVAVEVQSETTDSLEETIEDRAVVREALDEKLSESSQKRQSEQIRLNSHRSTLDERALEDAEDIECRANRATKLVMRQFAEATGYKDGASQSQESPISEAVGGSSC